MTKQTPQIEDIEPVIALLTADPNQDDGARKWLNSARAFAGDKIRVLRYVLDHAPVESPRVLDVGAQIGTFAILAARFGCRSTAVDYPNYARQFGPIAREQGVDYRECDVRTEPLPFSDGSFEFVTYTDVIEHHAFSPKHVLSEIHRVLAPGGRLILTTPNHASIYNRVKLLLGGSINDGFDSYFGCDPNDIYPGHHREYTRNELRSALERTGFSVAECRIIEEDVRSLMHHIRHEGLSVKTLLRERQALILRLLGPLWERVSVPLGRYHWAVGQKV